MKLPTQWELWSLFLTLAQLVVFFLALMPSKAIVPYLKQTFELHWIAPYAEYYIPYLIKDNADDIEKTLFAFLAVKWLPLYMNKLKSSILRQKTWEKNPISKDILFVLVSDPICPQVRWNRPEIQGLGQIELQEIFEGTPQSLELLLNAKKKCKTMENCFLDYGDPDDCFLITNRLRGAILKRFVPPDGYFLRDMNIPCVSEEYVQAACFVNEQKTERLKRLRVILTKITTLQKFDVTFERWKHEVVDEWYEKYFDKVHRRSRKLYTSSSKGNVLIRSSWLQHVQKKRGIFEETCRLDQAKENQRTEKEYQEDGLRFKLKISRHGSGKTGGSSRYTPFIDYEARTNPFWG